MDALPNTRSRETFNIYLSHILSSWGDRMWAFAVGLYLITLYPQSLQLTAIYGVVLCVSVIIFGATLGKWIDKTKRITVARLALVVQNTSVVICSILLICLLYYKHYFEVAWGGGGKTMVIVAIIAFAVIANLASEASKIALEKDWIVVLSGGNKMKLAKMNATMRSIDLTTYILAPILVGQIITYASQIIGASFIAFWNILSGFFEYYLLTNIYKRVPELAIKNIPLIVIDSPTESTSKSTDPEQENNNSGQPLLESRSHKQKRSSQSSTHAKPDTPNTELDFDELTEISLASPTSHHSWNPFMNKIHPTNGCREESKSCLVKTASGFKARFNESLIGWKDYFGHQVRWAGIGLALLYMTVLGFDIITTAYAYSQGVSESMLGIMTAMGAAFGILGSVSFPWLRKNLGKCVTGILGFGIEVACLLLCVISIIAPGSPFINKDLIFNQSEIEGIPWTNGTIPSNLEMMQSSEHKALSLTELWNYRISVLLLMSGIIMARFGLWIADLSVVQIFQEEIPENKRGILNGVQGSLNQSMNLLKFIIVTILPNPEQYAYLIVLSWVFVFLGWIFFIIFSCTHRRPTENTSNMSCSELSSIGVFNESHKTETVIQKLIKQEEKMEIQNNNNT